MNEEGNAALELVRQFTEGKLLTESDAHQLEAELEQNPSDIYVRAKLIGFYASDRETCASEFLKHQVWVIDHCPEHELAALSVGRSARLKQLVPTAYKVMREKWLERIDSMSVAPKAFLNAANFFILNHDEDEAESLLRLALLREPDNAAILDKLSKVVGSLSKRSETPNAKEALVLCQKAVESAQDAFQQFSISLRLPILALQSNSPELAQKFALDVLSAAKQHEDEISHYGYALHVAHTVLGVVSFQQGNVELAREYLRNSVQVPNSFAFSTAGPVFTLAEKLLEAGYTNDVLRFLDSCEQLELDKAQLKNIKTLRDKCQFAR